METMLMTRVIVRDGRPGRDPALVTEAGGEVLHEYDMEYAPDKWPDVGDQLTLSNGDIVAVIGAREDVVTNDRLEITRHTLTLFISEVWDA